MVFWKSWVGCVWTHMSNFVVSGPTFIGLFSPNAGGIAVDTLVFRFWTCLSLPEIFAIEVDCNVARFWHPIFFFLGGGTNILGIRLQNWTNFRSRGKFSRGSAERTERSRGVKKRKKEKETSAVTTAGNSTAPCGRIKQTICKTFLKNVFVYM